MRRRPGRSCSREPDPRRHVLHAHPGLPVGLAGLEPGAMGEPPSLPNEVPVVPTPDEVRRLMAAAEQSRRPQQHLNEANQRVDEERRWLARPQPAVTRREEIAAALQRDLTARTAAAG